MNRIDRRQLLKALGLAGLAGAIPGLSRRRARAATPPTRVVFFIQPHGQVPLGWNLAIPDGRTDIVAERALTPLALADFPDVLKPLHAFRGRALVLEGLAHTSVIHDRVQVLASGAGDDNDHNLAVAGVLTGARVQQREGLPCSGGARSIDQEIARRLAGAGRFDSRVYGADYVPNQSVAPFSFLGAGQPSPVVKDPATALADLLGILPPEATSDTPTRAQRITALRGSVLDAVAEEFDAVAPRLSRAGREKLASHRDLVHDLSRQLGSGQGAHCEAQLDLAGSGIDAFMRLVRLAFSCDLTRVVTYVAPVPEPPEFGYPAEDTVHFSYAHASIQGATSCGAQYTPRAERAMIDLGAWYASKLAILLAELDAVPEGDGTLLDHTVVVWLTELATGTHRHEDAFFALFGGTSAGLRTGRYVRYPRTLPNPFSGRALTGPGHNRLWVTLLRALGHDDRSFGLEQATGAEGSAISLTGELSELLR